MKISNFVLMVIIGLLVIGGVYATEPTSIKQAPTDYRMDNSDRTLSVVGNAQIDSKPDQAMFIVRVETKDKQAKTAQAENARLTRNIINALRAAGMTDNDIETLSYTVYPYTEYKEVMCVRAPCPREYDEYFRVQNSIKVTTKKLDAVGKLIDTAVQSGATNINSVQFELSKDKQKEIQKQALQDAVQVATDKARAMADSLGVRMTGVMNANEESFGYYPVPIQRYAMMEDSSIAAETPISPSDVTVRARISVTYSIA